MIFGLTACGKKAKDSKAEEPSNAFIEKSEMALIEENHKELYEAILAKDVDKFKLLLENKSQVDLNKTLQDGETLMSTAVTKDLYPIVELLLENNANISKANNKKETPLIIAAKLGYENLVRLLIYLGSKPDLKDQDGNTALHHAILNVHEEMALFLINSGSNIDITNNDNKTALKLAEILKLKKVLDLLKILTQSNVGSPSRIDVENLILLGDFDSLNQLFIKYPGIIVEYRDLNYYVLAMTRPHDIALSMTQLLIMYGADLDGPVNSDITPLTAAVKRKYENFVELMLRENVNPNVLDKKGNSPLIWAIKSNSSAIVSMLIKKNAMEKYIYYENEKKKTMNACEVAQSMKKLSLTPTDKKSNEEILNLLGCGLRWLL